MTLAIITLLTGLSLSAISAYYSILGLMAIFAAAPIPIMIMGSVLEVSKLVATVWLKQNWNSAPLPIKSYLSASVIILMIITSIGCFGFLSKAHLDQALPSGEIVAKVAILDEKIKVERDIIDTNRRALQQLDAAVDQIMARSTDERGAARSSAIRRSQQKERTQLAGEIETAQKKISALTDERAPLASSLRQVEAEVGPIKYIAAFFYGSTDQTILEKAVTWVIIILIVVFDPLAVILLLASQISFQKVNPLQPAPDQDPPSTPSEEKEESKKKERSDDLGENISTQESLIRNTITDYPYLKKPWIWKLEEGKEQEDVANSNKDLEKAVDELIDEVKGAIEKKPKPYHWAEQEIDQEYEKPSENPVLISETDYQSLSKKNFEKEIQKWVGMVKSNQVTMSDVPKSILLEVRARI